MSNQSWNNVIYVNIEIYNFKQRPLNLVYFNIDIKNVRQRQNNVSFSTSSFSTLMNVKTTLWIR